METTAEENDLSSSEQQLLLRIREASATTWTSECLEPEMVLDLIQQKEDSAATAQQMAHIASCAACRQSYVSMLETWHLAQEVRSLETAATAAVPISMPVSKETEAIPRKTSVLALFSRLFSSRPQSQSGTLAKSPNWNLQRKAFVLAVGVILVALPLISAWQIKQNAALQAQWAEQTSSTRQADRETKTAVAYDAPSVPELALLGESTHTRQMGNSGNDMLPLTLMYPPAKALLQEDTPTFQWKPVQGAASYEVHIRSLSNRQSTDQPSPRRAETQWKADPPLQRGDVFEWGVTAYDSNNNIITRSYSEHFLILAKK